ncbi:Ligand of Numb protein X 2 [Chionoecetes opilio]|uniref:Ligand of Numb protein X 2 n=1 Tax=Chionoecetes opilio TaxID=41210 RepID=A0A8J4YF05_CHIOP|nr:Ligand of Numb protein X 2 [Chionoecetes opilio]
MEASPDAGGVGGRCGRRRNCRTCGQQHQPHEPHLYDYIDEVDEDITCHICLQPLVTPLDTPCGHTFCRPCLLSYLTVQQSCPVDRKPLSQQLCSPSSLVLKKLLEKLKVKCPNEDHCTHEMQRGDLEDHLKYRCPGNWVSCPHTTSGCDFRGTPRSMATHTADCTFKDQGTKWPRSSACLVPPQRCVVVQEVFPDGVVAQDGRLQPGDQIIEVDGVDMTSETHQAVCQALRRPNTVLRLGVYRERIEAQKALLAPPTPPNGSTQGSVAPHPQPGETMMVSLRKESNRQLGLKLGGRRTEPGIFVMEVLEGSVAPRTGVSTRLTASWPSTVRMCDPALPVLHWRTKSAPERLVPRLDCHHKDVNKSLGDVTDSVGEEVGLSASSLHQSSGSISSVARGTQDEDTTPPALPPRPRHTPAHSRSNDQLVTPDTANSDGVKEGRSLEVPLHRTTQMGGNESLGMRIGGGLGSNEGDTPIYIANINPQGPVGKSKQVKKGDVVLSVNGQSLVGLTHGQAVALLKATAELAGVTLSLLDGPETSQGSANFVPSWLFWQKLPRSLHVSKSVVLHRATGASLGFSIVGGADPQRGAEPIHVLFVVQSSPAAADGKLRCGDRLLAVDGHSLEQVRHAAAVSLLKQAKQRVHLQVVSWLGTEL